jgi:T-complex protein 1 subunit beta
MSHTGEITVTNDGATILKAIHVDNAAAKVLVDISKTQDEEVGDGTTSVCVLAGELLREAEKLIELNIHPQTIVEGIHPLSHITRMPSNPLYSQGYNMAAAIARKRLEEIAECHGDDEGE